VTHPSDDHSHSSALSPDDHDHGEEHFHLRAMRLTPEHMQVNLKQILDQFEWLVHECLAQAGANEKAQKEVKPTAPEALPMFDEKRHGKLPGKR
jgi:hypothetical protein